MKVTIDIPDKFSYLGDHLKLKKEIKQNYALSLYRDEKISMSAAAEVAGMDLYEFMAECKRNNIPVISYSSEELDKELNNFNIKP